MLDVRLLGKAHVCFDGSDAPPSALTLLAYLSLHERRWYDRTFVASCLNPDVDEHRARHRLSTALWRLRRWLSPEGSDGPNVVLAQGSAIRLDPSFAFQLDVERFETAALAFDGNDLACDRDACRLRAALDLYRGELLEGCYDDWVIAERARLADLHLHVIRRLMAWHRDRRETAEVIRLGERALRDEPLREDVHRDLMAAYAEGGQPDRALDQFARCRRLLAEQLGVDPMPETIALAGRLGGPAPVAHLDVDELSRQLELTRRQLGELAGAIDRSLAALREQVRRLADRS